MAFDGVVIANIVYDMNRLLTGGRIYKIYQPEADELLLVVKNNKETDLLPLIHRFLSILYWNLENKNLLHQKLLFSQLFLLQKLEYHLF